MALLNMQQEISSLEQRLKVVEQISVNQRRQQIDQTSKYLVGGVRASSLPPARLCLCRRPLPFGSLINAIIILSLLSFSPVSHQDNNQPHFHDII